MSTNRTMICVKDYLVQTFPNNYTVKAGETLVVEGYLMGRDIVLRHTNGSFVVFHNLDKHFKEKKQ